MHDNWDRAFNPQRAEEIYQDIVRRGWLPALGGCGAIEQDPIELTLFVDFILHHGVHNYLEVGTSRGGLINFMISYCKLDGYGMNLFEPEWRKDRVFVGDCTSPEALKFADDHGPFDLVFIDADHKYESVSRDTDLYQPKAKKFVAFHDICGLRDCEGAKRHWEETHQKHTYFEFINLENPVGIGLIVKDPV